LAIRRQSKISVRIYSKRDLVGAIVLIAFFWFDQGAPSLVFLRVILRRSTLSMCLNAQCQEGEALKTLNILAIIGGMAVSWTLARQEKSLWGNLSGIFR